MDARSFETDKNWRCSLWFPHCVRILKQLDPTFSFFNRALKQTRSVWISLKEGHSIDIQSVGKQSATKHNIIIPKDNLTSRGMKVKLYVSFSCYVLGGALDMYGLIVAFTYGWVCKWVRESNWSYSRQSVMLGVKSGSMNLVKDVSSMLISPSQYEEAVHIATHSVVDLCLKFYVSIILKLIVLLDVVIKLVVCNQDDAPSHENINVLKSFKCLMFHFIIFLDLLLWEIIRAPGIMLYFVVLTFFGMSFSCNLALLEHCNICICVSEKNSIICFFCSNHFYDFCISGLFLKEIIKNSEGYNFCLSGFKTYGSMVRIRNFYEYRLSITCGLYCINFKLLRSLLGMIHIYFLLIAIFVNYVLVLKMNVP